MIYNDKINAEVDSAFAFAALQQDLNPTDKAAHAEEYYKRLIHESVVECRMRRR